MRRSLSSLVACLILTGCSSKPVVEAPPAVPPPKVEAPPPEPVAPPPVTLSPACTTGEAGSPTIRAYGAFDERWTREGPGRCSRVIDLRPLTVYVDVDASSDEEALSAVRISGAQQTQAPKAFPLSAGRRQVAFHLAGGQALDQVEVAVRPGLTAVMTREPGPALHFSRETPEGAWAPLEPGESLPPGPVRLRIQVTGPIMASPSVVDLRAGMWDEFKDYRYEAVSPDTLLITLDSPPPLVRILAASVLSDQGVRLTGATHFYVGPSPVLQAVDPTTGKVQELGAAPAEIHAGAISPDGRYAAMVTQLADSDYELTLQVLDLTSGRYIPTGLRVDLLPPEIAFDHQGRLVVPLLERLVLVDPATGRVTEAAPAGVMWDSVSPDARYVVGYRGDPPILGKTGAWTPPPAITEVVLYDLAAGQTRAFPAEGFLVQWPGLHWLPDGQLLLSVTTSDQPGMEKTLARYAIDPATGERTPCAGDIPAPRTRWDGSIFRLGALPDGRSLQVFWENASHMRYPLP